MSTQVDPAVQQQGQSTNGTTQNWRDTLPDDLKALPSLEKFKGVPDLAKSYTELEKLTGSAVKLPKGDAQQDEWDKFYSRLGRPEAPDKYDFKRPEVPEGVTYDEELETKFKGMAHKAGLHPRQAQALLEEFHGVQVERMKAFNDKMAQGVEEIKKEWGNDYDKKVGMATRAVKELGGEELQAMLNETGLGNHPILVKLFARLGEDMTEEIVVTGESTTQSGGKEAIEAKIAEIMKSEAYRSRMDTAEHRKAIDDVFKLNMQLLPPEE